MEPTDRPPVQRPAGRQAWLVVCVVMFALVVAASSDSVRVWTNPESTGRDAPAAPSAPSPSRAADEPGEGSPPVWIGDVLRVLSIGLFGAIVIAGAFTAAKARPAARAWRWAPPPERDEPFAAPLPDADDRVVRIDAGAARASLTQGPPRNAIVACWMQLERDVAAAGLPRRSAETSGEYVERVVSRVSLDPAPIGELASLYCEARFSIHELGEEQRDRAVAALAAVVDAMPAGVVR